MNKEVERLSAEIGELRHEKRILESKIRDREEQLLKLCVSRNWWWTLKINYSRLEHTKD